MKPKLVCEFARKAKTHGKSKNAREKHEAMNHTMMKMGVCAQILLD